MQNLLNETVDIFASLFANDAFVMSEAFATDGAWLAGLIFMIVGTFVLFKLYKRFPTISLNMEKTVMVVSYLLIGIIISVEVVRRFAFDQQAAWSTTLPPFLFLVMAWFGCVYNVKLRTHLSFSEFRVRMSRKGQMACLCLDAFLWLVLSWVIVVTSLRVTVNSAMNFQVMLGTDDVMQWWFLLTVPLTFLIIAVRVVENLIADINNYKNGDPLIEQTVIGGE